MAQLIECLLRMPWVLFDPQHCMGQVWWWTYCSEASLGYVTVAGIFFFFLFLFFSRQGFSVALEPVLELTLYTRLA